MGMDNELTNASGVTDINETQDTIMEKIFKKLKMNAVFLKDFRISSRNSKTLTLVIVINVILALIALGGMALNGLGTSTGSAEAYSMGYEVYVVLMIIETVLVSITAPGLTAGAITNERERQTLEILLCTKMTHFQIVRGKLYSALMDILLIYMSALPIIFTVYAYGGVRFRDIFSYFLAYMLIGLLFSSYGIFCSSICKKTSSAIVLAYVLIIASYALVLVVFMVLSLLMIGTVVNGQVIYPDVIFLELVALGAMLSPSYLVGNYLYNWDLQDIIYDFTWDASYVYHDWFNFVSEHSLIIGIIVQFLISVFYLWVSSKLINTVKKVKKK